MTNEIMELGVCPYSDKHSCCNLTKKKKKKKELNVLLSWDNETSVSPLLVYNKGICPDLDIKRSSHLKIVLHHPDQVFYIEI